MGNEISQMKVKGTHNELMGLELFWREHINKRFQDRPTSLPQPARSLPSIVPLYVDCTALNLRKISIALSKCLPTSAPGPDTIPYSVWKFLHRIPPEIHTSRLGPLLHFGHYS